MLLIVCAIIEIKFNLTVLIEKATVMTLNVKTILQKIAWLFLVLSLVL